MKSILLLIALVSSSAFAAEHGLSLEHNRGVGYTFKANKFWAGINLYGHQATSAGLSNDAKQLVLSPRIFANYDVCEAHSIPVFVGLSWAEDIGNSSVTRDRVIAPTMGMHVRVVPNLDIAGWINVVGLYYEDSAGGASNYDEYRKGYLEFGGISGTYFF